MVYYNNDRNYQGKSVCGRRPLNTLLMEKPVWAEKINPDPKLNKHVQNDVTVNPGLEQYTVNFRAKFQTSL